MTNQAIVRFIKTYGLALIVAVVFLFWLKNVLIGSFEIPESSCELNVKIGDKVYVEDETWIVSELDKLDSIGRMYMRFNRVNN